MLRRILLASFAVSLVGCNGTDSTTVVVEEPVAPSIASFTPSLTTVVSGSQASVTWSWTYAKPPNPEPACTVDQGVGAIGNGAAASVKLTSDTTFTITCTSTAGTSTATARITVAPTPVPPILSTFSASPASITAGTATNVSFSWTFNNTPAPTPSCLIDQGVGAVDASGVSRSLKLGRDTRYVITCSSSAGASTAAATVKVTAAPVPPKPINFAVNPATVVSGIATPVSFSWSYDGIPTSTPTCTIDNGVGTATDSTVTLSADTTYTLTCTSTEGSNTATVKLAVRPQVAPVIGSVWATPDTVLTGTATTVSWSWSYANAPVPEPTCTIDHGVGAIKNGGTSTVNLTADTTFNLTCTNGVGPGSGSKVIKVVGAPVAPVIATFKTMPPSTVQGEPTWVSFSWTYTTPPVPLPTCTIDQGIGPANSVTQLTLDTDTTYTISCTNSAGTGGASALLTVIPATPPVIADFTASPGRVEMGARQITWSWGYANSPIPAPTCSIDHGVGLVSPGDTTTVDIAGDVTFTLNCANVGGGDGQSAVVTAYNRAVAVVAGYAHTCALLSHGAVMCWGSNGQGQLGDGTYSSSPLPVYVKNLTDAVALTAGDYHTCALTSAGGVKCWGYNYYGEVGDPASYYWNEPTDVVGLSSGVKLVDAGAFHTCALLDDSSTMCWGANWYGQLGDGTTNEATTPVAVVGASSASALAAGYAHTCIALTRGGAQCWGQGGSGQLGNGGTAESHKPTAVVGLLANVTRIAAGQNHTCARLSDASVQCWGSNTFGASGQLSGGPLKTATLCAGLSGVANVRAGGYTTCVRRSSGELECFGRNDSGQLGNGTVTSGGSPVTVVGLAGQVIDFAIGGSNACAVLDDGHVRCWGGNDYGQLGDGTTSIFRTPVAVSAVSGAAAIASAGYAFSCATLGSGIECWGGDGTYALGTGSYAVMSPPVAVSNPPAGVVQMRSGYGDTCVLDGTGALSCWGSNISQNYVPRVRAGLGSGVTSFDLTYYHACVTVNGAAKCLGESWYGQIGDGTTNNTWGYDPGARTYTYLPKTVTGLDSGVRATGAGWYHSCAALDAGGVKCWGYNGNQQLGDGSSTTRSSPVSVVGLSDVVKALSLGFSHSCALTDAGGVKCWGSSDYFGLGGGDVGVRDIPGLTSGVAAIRVSQNTTCALKTNGEIRCLGYNDSGQAGIGNIGWANTPTLVALPSAAVSLGLWDDHACATLDTGALYCWGRNNRAQVTGTYDLTARLVAAVGP